MQGQSLQRSGAVGAFILRAAALSSSSAAHVLLFQCRCCLLICRRDCRRSSRMRCVACVRAALPHWPRIDGYSLSALDSGWDSTIMDQISCVGDRASGCCALLYSISPCTACCWMCSPRQRAPAADNPTYDIVYSGGGCDEQRRTPHGLSIDVLSSTALFLAPARRLRVASVWLHACAWRSVCVRSGG